MNLAIIATAIRDIQELEPALAWLKEYGGNLRNDDPASVTIMIGPRYASACPGFKESVAQLNAIARLHIEEIVRHAITDAQNTIDLRREQILAEASQ